ncbi:MAG: hypothetical protein KAG43_03970, partial [Candidatus Marithrix sp.]|nr:hypothetical protein [Candidatus Marithrix sp.]
MATHILLEFKHTESVNENVFRQALGYDTFYKRAQNLTHGQVQTFVISSKKTQARTLAEFGYQATEKCGVYKSTHSLLNSIILISLNELSSEVHNSWLKCFASHMLEKKAAFGLVQNEGMRYLTSHLELFMNGLSKLIIGGNMSEVITPEVVMEMGRKSL